MSSGNESRKNNDRLSVKLSAVFVVLLFITSAFCVMLAGPTQSEAATENGTVFSPGETERPDSPTVLTKTTGVADFTKNPTAAVGLLNAASASKKCEWRESTKTLTLVQVDFLTDCSVGDTEHLGAAIILPSDSTIVLKGGSRVGTGNLNTELFEKTYGLYCEGNLTINVMEYTIEFVLDDFVKNGNPEKDVFSSAIYVGGKLTVVGKETGRLATSVRQNTYSPAFGIYAGEFELIDSELICDVKSGRNTGLTEISSHSTVGLYSKTITIDILNNQKVSIWGGSNNTFSDKSKSCGIVTEKMEVKHGIVTALGGSSMNNEYSCGIEFVGTEQSLIGAGNVCASGGVANGFSYGIYGSALSITDTNLYVSAMYSNNEICVINVVSLALNNCHMNCMLGFENTVNKVTGIRCSNGLIAEKSDIFVEIHCGRSVFGMTTDTSTFVDCKVKIEIFRSPFDHNTNMIGFTSHMASFDKCDVSVKISDTRFMMTAVTVNETKGEGVLTINNSKFRVETGNNVGSSSVSIEGIDANNLHIFKSDVYVKAGNTNFYTRGIFINGGEALIEDSKVESRGGDVVEFNSDNAFGSTSGIRTNGPLTIKNSDVKFIGGKTKVLGSNSFGLQSERSESPVQEITISGSRFLISGETKSISVMNKELFKITCSEKLYGLNKESGMFEEVDYSNIDKYETIGTYNWIESGSSDTSSLIAMIVLAILIIGVISVFFYRRN